MGFQKRLLLDNRADCTYYGPTPPSPPPELLAELQAMSGASRTTSDLWYDVTERQSSGEITTWIQKNTEETGTKTMSADLPGKLEHGSKRHPRSILVSFGYDAATPVVIQYRLHASNQP